MHKHYKPLRNYLSKHQTRSSLESIWRHAKEHSVIKVQRALDDSSTAMLPWELELVAREIILNGSLLQQASGGEKGMNPWKAVGLVRELTTHISDEYVHSTEDALAAVVPLTHQQMLWHDNTFSRIARYGQIYRHPPLAEIMQSVLAISLSDWLKIGLIVYGGLDKSFWNDRSIYSHVPGIDRRAVERFFALMSKPVEEVRRITALNQRYDRHWAHTFNPLRASPINFFEAEPERIFSPVPQLLIWRLTDGIYYDLVGAGGEAFADAFGKACELYVGNVLKVALKESEAKIEGERPYSTGEGEKAGVDWLVSDHTGHLFVECKAKRLTLPAKMTGPGKSMDKDLLVLAGYIVQNYKNIRDALQGKVAGFNSGGLPIFSAIVTLEPWWLLTQYLKDRLHSLVEEALQKEGLPIGTVNQYPYKILSFVELEQQAQDIARVGIANVYASDGAYSGTIYKGCLFPETLAELMPDIANQAGLDRLGRRL